MPDIPRPSPRSMQPGKRPAGPFVGGDPVGPRRQHLTGKERSDTKQRLGAAKPDPSSSSGLWLEILGAVSPDISVFAVQFHRSQSSREFRTVLILEGDH